MELHEQLRRVLRPEEIEAERQQRIQEREQQALERQRRRQQVAERQLQHEAELATRRRCRGCDRPLRKDAAPSTHWCSQCLATLRDACPKCGRPKQLESKLCRHCHATTRWGRPEPIERTNHGRCLGIQTFDGQWLRRTDCTASWGNLNHRHCPCGRAMSADPDLEFCGRCVARELAQPDNGHCQLCGLWLSPLGRPHQGWEPDYNDPPPGRVCGNCQQDLNRTIGVAAGRLRALLHTDRVEIESRSALTADFLA